MHEAERYLATFRAEVAQALALTPVVLVNGKQHEWRPGLTVADLLQQRETDDETVATAVNGTFVPRHVRPAKRLVPGDAVLVFGAIVGG
jgi:sulfur carrier protein